MWERTFSSNLRQRCARTGHERQDEDGKGELRLHLRQLKTAEKSARHPRIAARAPLKVSGEAGNEHNVT